MSFRCSSVAPTTSTRFRSGSASTRPDSSCPGIRARSKNLGPPCARASRLVGMSSSLRNAWVASTTRPPGVTTSANVSAVPVARTEPPRGMSADSACPRERRSLSNARSRSEATRRYTKSPTAARTIAIAAAKKSVNRMRIGIRLIRLSAGNRHRARSRATPRRRAGRPSPAGSARRRRSRLSGSRTRSPRRVRSAEGGSAPVRACA